MVLICIGPFLQRLEAVDESVADGVCVEIGDVEDFDAGLLQNLTIERSVVFGEVGKRPYCWRVVEAAFLVRVQVEFEGADGLVLELDGELGVRVVVVFWRWDVFLENGTFG